MHNETCFPLDGNHHPRVSVFNKAFLTTALLITNPRFCSTLTFLSIVIAQHDILLKNIQTVSNAIYCSITAANITLASYRNEM